MSLKGKLTQMPAPKYIVSDGQILDGTPVVKGTRVPVATIQRLYREGYTEEQLRSEILPSLTVKRIRAVLAEVMGMGVLAFGETIDQNSAKAKTSP
jgi:uncharacterized protein (DUF433 family)